MKIESACIYVLNIPFVEPFRHRLQNRDRADSIVVKLTADCGVSGFGEGAPRPYVTGETQETSVEHIRKELIPRVMGVALDAVDSGCIFAWVHDRWSGRDPRSGIVWNASRCAVELALADCFFRSRNASVAAALPPQSPSVTYSGVITAGSSDTVRNAAERCRAAGFAFVKVKVSGPDDLDHVALVREIVGPFVSLRLDANGAFDRATAVRFLASAARYGIECIEQPIPRGNPADLAALRAESPIPVMADESLLTIEDARALIAHGAADYFNLRISKCGGLHPTLAIADLAKSAGVGIQVGCQVGETAILSAAGRLLAAHLGNIRFVEGSYSRRLLEEDIAEEDIGFGPGGRAPVLTGVGLGVTVREDVLQRYAVETMPIR